MIASSRTVLVSAFAVACSLHLAGLMLRPAEDEVQIEGGAPNAAAALGNSFTDMVAGAAPPVEPTEGT
ncbi:MAG: hypothetical protein AB3N23_09005 [Paracoccaceae bacterium]